MRKPLTRENIASALIVAVRDQSQTHERDDEKVIHRFLTEIDRASWIEPTIAGYRAACCTIDESSAAEASWGVCDACDGGFAWRAHACPACNGTGRAECTEE